MCACVFSDIPCKSSTHTFILTCTCSSVRTTLTAICVSVLPHHKGEVGERKQQEKHLMAELVSKQRCFFCTLVSYLPAADSRFAEHLVQSGLKSCQVNNVVGMPELPYFSEARSFFFLTVSTALTKRTAHYSGQQRAAETQFLSVC